MNEYTHGECVQYSVDVKSSGVAYFIIQDGETTREYETNLIQDGLWGETGYSDVCPQRHFICYEDGELITTLYPHFRLILIEKLCDSAKPRTFFRAKQWEYDWWMSMQFPYSANAKVYQMIKLYYEYVNFEVE